MLVTRPNMQQPNIGNFDSKCFPPFLGGTPLAHVDREILSSSFYSTFHRGREPFDSLENERERDYTIIHHARGRYTPINSILPTAVNFHAFIMGSRVLDVLH